MCLRVSCKIYWDGCFIFVKPCESLFRVVRYTRKFSVVTRRARRVIVRRSIKQDSNSFAN